MTSESRPPSRAPGVVTESADIERGTRILLTADGTGHELNATASALWELCDGETSVEEIAASVAQAFGMPEPQAREEVEAALALLIEQGLLVDADRSGGG